jgi:hypothetical protein
VKPTRSANEHFHDPIVEEAESWSKKTRAFPEDDASFSNRPWR